jgi:hypothetical protein
MADRPAVADGVLLQNVLVASHQREAGYRIYADGRFERRSVGEQWVGGPALTPGQVQRVRGVIGDAAIDRLKPRYEPSAPSTGDGGDAVLHVDAAIGDTVHHVAVVEPCKVPAIDGLIAEVDEILKEVWSAAGAPR